MMVFGLRWFLFLFCSGFVLYTLNTLKPKFRVYCSFSSVRVHVHVSVLHRNKASGMEAGWWGFPDVLGQ